MRKFKTGVRHLWIFSYGQEMYELLYRGERVGWFKSLRKARWYAKQEYILARKQKLQKSN